MLNKKLETGTIVKAWTYEEGNTVGITVGSNKETSGDPIPLLHIESVRCAEGTVNRIVIKNDTIKKTGLARSGGSKGKD